MFTIGIDMSLKSPCWVIHNKKTQYLFVYFAINRRSDDIQKEYNIEHKYIKRLILVPFDCRKMKGMIRNICIVDQFKQSLAERCYISENRQNIEVYIEGYSFNAISSSRSQLYELTGIIKYELEKKGIPYSDIAPTRVKKLFTKKGNATKSEMYDEFIRRNMPDLLSEFGLTKNKGIANPVQDIVDATAICLICLKTNNNSK